MSALPELALQPHQQIGRPLTDLAYCRSVRVGDLWLPPEVLTQQLRNYCPHIFCLTKHPTFPYSLRGSGSAVRIGKAHFVFLFWHQVVGFQPADIAIDPVGDGTNFVTGSNYCFVADGIDADDDLADMCALGFAVEKYNVDHFGARFFNSKPDDIWPNHTRDIFLIYGFPTCLQKVCPEGTSIAGTCVYVTGRYAGRSSSQYVHRLELMRYGKWDPDGLSGGLVLHLGHDYHG